MTAERSRLEAEYRRLYHPPWHGVHVCGASPDDQAMTVAAFPCSSRSEARRLFERLKEFQTVEGEPYDLVVDLCEAGDISEDFCLTRQMLDRLSRAVDLWRRGT